jgi:hypothetical protein
MRVHLGIGFIFFINSNFVLSHLSDFYNFLNIFSVNLTFTFSKLTQSKLRLLIHKGRFRMYDSTMTLVSKIF